MLLWYKIWLLNGFPRIRAKPNPLGKRTRVCESFSSRQPSRESFILASPCNVSPFISNLRRKRCRPPLHFHALPEGPKSRSIHKTKLTRATCRRRTGNQVPRAEIFGDLITADHKVLNEDCQSRNNHRYANVVQDSGTQWLQSCPCKTTSSQETEKSLR